MKIFIKAFFSKFDQIRKKLWFWSNFLKKSLMKNFIFCAVISTGWPSLINKFWDSKIILKKAIYFVR